MSKKPKGLWADPRSGIWYIRRKIPVDLRVSFNAGELYKVSLGTADAKEAERRFRIANGEYEAKIEAFRAALANAGQGALSPQEADDLVRRFLLSRSQGGFARGAMEATFLLRDLDEAVAELSGTRSPTAQQMSAEEWVAYRRRMSGVDDDSEFSTETLSRLTAEAEARHREPGEVWLEFYRRVSRRRWRPLLNPALATLKRHLKLPLTAIPGIDEPLADALAAALAASEVREQVPLQQDERRRNRPSRLRPNMKLEELLDAWKTRADKPRPKSINAAEKAVKDFKSYAGDVNVMEITSADCFDYRDAVALMPKSMPQNFRAMPFAQLVEIYAKRTDIERLEPATVKKYLAAIQALLSFAFQEQWIPSNVGAGIAVAGYGKRGKRRSFTPDELRALFAAPLFTAAWSERQSQSSVSDDTVRWLFILSLFSGARIEELGQLLLTDVMKDGDVWYLDVDDYVDAGSELAKSLKTDGSRRLIPLHDHAIELGFVARWQKLHDAGSTQLFPDLPANNLLVRTQQASRRCGRIIDRYVTKDPRLVFHSLRHTFKDLCRKARISKEVHDQVTGHAPVDVSGGYGNGLDVSDLHHELHLIDFTFIEWESIEVASRH